ASDKFRSDVLSICGASPVTKQNYLVPVVEGSNQQFANPSHCGNCFDVSAQKLLHSNRFLDRRVHTLFEISCNSHFTPSSVIALTDFVPNKTGNSTFRCRIVERIA